MHIKKILHYLSINPFNTETEDGRQQERYRRVAWSIMANIVSKGTAMLTMVMSVNLTISYLGGERFGIWMTIASFTGLLGFLDLGVGNALINHIAKAAVDKNHEKLPSAISGGLGLMLIISIAATSILIVAAYIMPWEKLIKLNSEVLYDEVKRASIWFAGLFGLNMFTSAIHRIYSGLQKAYYSHMVNSLGSIVSLIFLYQVSKQQVGIEILLLVTFGIQSIVSLILLFKLFYEKLFNLKIVLSSCAEQYKTILHTGGLFFILQICCMIGWGADNLIISATLGASQVAVYSITQRLFQFVSQPLAVINAPLWAAYADALNHNDKQFIKCTLIKSIKLSFIITSMLGLLFIVTGYPLIKFWTNSTVHVPISLLTIYAVWVVFDSLGSTFAMFMNGCNIIKPQLYGLTVLIMTVLPVKYFLITNFGIEVMILGFIVLFMSNITFWYGFKFRTLIKSVLI